MGCINSKDADSGGAGSRLEEAVSEFTARQRKYKASANFSRGVDSMPIVVP